MKIIPNRTMQLGGNHVARGKEVEVSAADGALAIRHGWAVEAKPKAGKPAEPAPKAGE